MEDGEAETKVSENPYNQKNNRQEQNTLEEEIE